MQKLCKNCQNTLYSKYTQHIKMYLKKKSFNFICSKNNSTEDHPAFIAEFLPPEVAHFYCQCSNGNGYRGSISQILSNALSTMPLLHLVNANVTLYVELQHCNRLKLTMDVTELLFQRSTSTNINFILKVKISDSAVQLRNFGF